MRTASQTTDTPQFELKRLTKDSIEPSLEKAEHYRLLIQPRLAESICLDILDVEPGPGLEHLHDADGDIGAGESSEQLLEFHLARQRVCGGYPQGQ